jgi:2,3-bisphosphoglycerate-independent phosphoglycerate mutase
MKYVVILGDGMADYALEELENKTPLQYAHTPNFDYLAKHGIVGRVKTIPEGMTPGSDTANMAVLGYNPKVFYSGRSPFEAASMGVSLKNTDVTFRCNLVTLSEEEKYSNRKMLDHSSDEITTEEAGILIEDISKSFTSSDIRFYNGISYRHLMVWNNVDLDFNLTPPHDIIGKEISEFLPKGKNSPKILEMMRQSTEILKNHPINIVRKNKGLRPANSIWIWGEGKAPLLTEFRNKYNLKGSVISAVDLIKGIGLCAGLKVVNVEGATGNIHTNFEGKALAAINELKNGSELVYVHIEAPDECGHRGEVQNKVKAIEYIDSKIVKKIIDELNKVGEDYKIMLLPDHPTPLPLRTHTSDAVPFVIYDSTKSIYNEGAVYDEVFAASANLNIEKGYKLMNYFVFGEI